MPVCQNGISVAVDHKENTTKEDDSVSNAAESLTIHAFPRIFNSKNWLFKVFWFLILSGALGVLIWLIYQRVADYKKHEVYVKRESNVVQPLPFPAVTVCNSDRFSGIPMKQFPMDNKTCSDAATSKSTVRQDIEFNKACKMFLSGFKDTFRFGGKDLPGFPDQFTSSNGVYPCFTFNKNGKAQQNVSGGGKGLDMIFFSDPNDIYHSKMANLSRFDDQRRGILIQIHDPYTEVSLDQSSGIAISPGFLTEIVIKRVTTSRKKHPFPSKCHTSETTKYKLIGGRYTRSNCISSCFQLKLQEKCGDIMKPNKSATQILCESDMYRRQPIEDCQCPQPCYEVAFPRIVSISAWPRMFQFESLKDEFSKMANTSDNIKLEYMQKRFSQVKIYYQDLLETKLSEEELYGVTNLLSEVGGLMGLLVGSSVISVIEIIWLSGIIIRKLFSSAFSKTDTELKEISTIKNSDIVVYNRTDHLVSATGQVDYRELIDSPNLAYSRRLEQTV